MANDMSQIEMSKRNFGITTFMAGKTRAWGIFEDRFGRIKKRFTVTMIGHWSGDRFMLDEEFVYDDGRRENRTWQVTPGEDGRFTATCADCIGQAKGQVVGDEIRMSYRFRLRLKSGPIKVRFFDRFYRVDDRRAVNRATMSKWGVRLGDLSLFFEREG